MFQFTFHRDMNLEKQHPLSSQTQHRKTFKIGDDSNATPMPQKLSDELQTFN